MNNNGWKQFGKVVAALVWFFSTISATFKKINVDAGIITWLRGSGKDYFVMKLNEIGREYLIRMKPLLEAEIDMDIEPKVAEPISVALSVLSHKQEGKMKVELRSDGHLYLDGRRVVLHYPDFQSQCLEITVSMALDGIKELPGISASLGEFLAANPDFYPEEWKRPAGEGAIKILYPETRFASYADQASIMYTYWQAGVDAGVCCGYLCVRNHFDEFMAMAVLEED